jgi:glycosyltransferase involved in cell wall biosynthesis
MQIKVIIDTLYNPLYSSFYLKGLIQKYGNSNITFSAIPFLQLKNRDNNFNFIIEIENKTLKYSIDFNDFNCINDADAYDWCDIYGKVNTNWVKTPLQEYPKIVSLVPPFGVRVWGFYKSLFHLIILLLMRVKRGEVIFRKFIGKHKRLFQNRLFYEQYTELSNCDEKYVFHLGTLWYNDEWNKNDEGVNKFRANFIRASKKLSGIHFEGGLLPQKNRSSEKLFSDVIYKSYKQMPGGEYVRKTKKSVLVFNTPSFWNCHGWKLGEYLAMGKAIISTPLYNDLPVPLVHGENIHFVYDDSLESIQEAIEEIINNHDYRKRLEIGARKYWETYGTPEKSLELLGI